MTERASHGRGKKIFLVHPLGANWVPGEKDMSRLANIMPPIGLCSLAAWLDRHGHRAVIHDCYAHALGDEALLRRLREEAPDFLGISATTSSFLDGMRLAQLAKSARPGLKVIVGGVHVSALRERLLREFPVIDYGIAGEGEMTLLELLEHGDDGLEEIQGLIHRDGGAGGEVIFNGPRVPHGDLDAFPFPAYEKLAGYPASYKLPLFSYPRSPGTTAISSRGCPYTCSYCDRSVFGRSFGFHSAEYMFELTRHLRRRFGIRHINFYDDLFTLKRERIAEYCERLLRGGLKMSFNCAARAEHLDAELLRLMKRAGCWMISLGIETGDPELLRRHRPTTRLELIRERMALIRRTGIRAKGLFIMGLPGETEASIDQSLRFVLDMPMDDFNLTKFTPFPGSPLYRDLARHGHFEEQWELMNCLNFVFVPEGLTLGRLEQRYREFYRRYYERPKVLLGYVAMLWRAPDSWRRFLANLGDFLKLRKDFK